MGARHYCRGAHQRDRGRKAAGIVERRLTLRAGYNAAATARTFSRNQTATGSCSTFGCETSETATSIAGNGIGYTSRPNDFAYNRDNRSGAVSKRLVRAATAKAGEYNGRVITTLRDIPSLANVDSKMTGGCASATTVRCSARR